MRSTSKLLVIVFAVLLLVGTGVVTAQNDPVAANKAALSAAVDGFNSGNPDAYYALFAETFQMNQGGITLGTTSRSDTAFFVGALRGAIPDLKLTPSVVIGEGDWLAFEALYSGTYTEPFVFPPISPDPVQPTGEPIAWTELIFAQFDDSGQIATLWSIGDFTVLFHQLGVMPAGDSTESSTPADSPAGYQALNADEFAATFVSGSEDRNRQLLSELLADDLADTELYASPYVTWNKGIPYEVTADAMQEEQAFLDTLNSAMPDLTQEAVVTVAEGDWLASVVVLRGTFSNDIDAFGTTLTHTGQEIAWMIGGLQRYSADGKIVEEWIGGDPMPLLQGLGLVPAFGQ